MLHCCENQNHAAGVAIAIGLQIRPDLLLLIQITLPEIILKKARLAALP